MTQDDSVRRLAEADAHALREQAEAWAEEHYLHDSVGAFEAGWEARQPAIDSLTTERDRLALWIGEAIEGKFGVLVATGFADLVACTHTRAEAAEADRERLREALGKVRDFQYDDRLTAASAYAMCRIAESALATPPSEGEQL